MNAKMTKKMRKEMEKFFEDEVFAPMRREEIKTTEQLLFEFEKGSLTEEGMILLVQRGCREELLSRCSNVAERESVWFEFVLADQVKEYIANEKVISKEEVASAIVTAEMKAAKLARGGKAS